MDNIVWYTILLVAIFTWTLIIRQAFMSGRRAATNRKSQWNNIYRFNNNSKKRNR